MVSGGIEACRFWKFKATPKGWTDNKPSLHSPQKIFIPKTKVGNSPEKRLQIIECPSSHVTENYMWVAYSNNIHMIYLPACNRLLGGGGNQWSNDGVSIAQCGIVTESTIIAITP